MSESKKNRAVFILLATLVVGFLFGVGSIAWLEKPEKVEAPDNKTRLILRSLDESRVQKLLVKYDEMLTLSDEQKELVQSVLGRCADAYCDLNDEIQAKHHSIRMEKYDSIEKVLNEEQLIIYRAHREERRKKHELKEKQDAVEASQ
ncbi:hypothetical protein MLD52_15905 [Puniceicoccaceae bacterium K14]|nr:hypothetical protein [Puniceicoccaceae bacterium K14]